MRDFGESRQRKLRTRLTAVIPLEDGTTISVTILASGYPKVENPDSAKYLDYQIGVEGFDEILIIEGPKAFLQLTRREHEPFTMHTPTEVPLESWPA